ncbi:MAG: hypothetical protein GF350_05585 [Chitinivibrionales bacterium]|nr:hypothetical protein [Chitinivibrionales bacterium]
MIKIKLFHNKSLIPAVFFLAFSAPVAAEDIELSGEQDGTYEKAEYLVKENIVVNEGRTLSFAPGSIIRFNRFAGLIVEGNLVCTGGVTEPIVFTSAHDRPAPERDDNAQPFDWNGIEITGTADSIALAYARISYSTFGLKISDTISHLSLKNLVFNDNGNANLTIGDSIVDIEDRTPFSLGPDTLSPAPGTDILSTAKDTSSQKITWRTPARIGLGAAALVGGSLWVGFHARALSIQEDYENAGTGQADRYRKDRDQAVRVRNVGAAVFGTGVAGFTVTLFF